MKTKNILLASCLCLCSLFICAETTNVTGDVPSNLSYDFVQNGCYYSIISMSDLTVELTCNNEDGYTPLTTYSGDFRVPETVEYMSHTFKVTRIHKYAFFRSVFGTLTIPASIQRIGIGNIDPDYAGTCRNLIIEDSDTPLEYHYDAIKQIYDSVYIGRNFSYKSDLPLIHANPNLRGEYHAITFGDKVTEIGASCEGCVNLTNVTLPSSVKSLFGTFDGCSNLKKIQGEGIETVYNAFKNSGIQTINMPNLRVLSGQFGKSGSYTSYAIQEGVLVIDNLFSNITSLTSVLIPGTVVAMGEGCFKGCTALQTVSVANPNPIMIDESSFDGMTLLNATLKVPAGSKSAYEKAQVWKNFSNIVEDNSLTSTLATVVVETGYNDEAITYSFSNESTTFQEYEFDTKYNIVPVGSILTIVVHPAENYHLSSLTINGNDVTEYVENNEYKISINSSAEFNVYANFQINAEPESGSEKDVYIVYVDKDNNYLKEQPLTLYLPEAPKIDGFSFVGWRPVASIIYDEIEIQAVYEYNSATESPALFVNPANPTQKLIRNGNVYILTDDHTYTVMGQEVK